jgi:hypothetical protein
MRIFVAYGYNPRGAWIEEEIFPLVESFGSEVVHGKVLEGQELPDSIKHLVQSSDALIAFATKRQELNTGAWITHPWVRDELNYALDHKKSALEVREEGVAELEQQSLRSNRNIPQFPEHCTGKRQGLQTNGRRQLAG